MIKHQVGFLILNKIFIKNASKIIINRCIQPKYYTTNSTNTDPKKSLSNVQSNQNEEDSLKLHKNLKNGKAESHQQKNVLNRKSSKIRLFRKNNQTLNKAKYGCNSLLVFMSSLLTKISVRRKASSFNNNSSDELKSSSVKDQVNEFAERLYELLQCEEHQALHIEKFLSSFEETGLRTTDPRLKSVVERILSAKDSNELTKDIFVEIIQKNFNMFEKAFTQQLIIPNFKKFSSSIENIYNKCKENEGGQIAKYIPELAAVNPNYFGVTLCTIDGQRYSIGDVEIPFTIQSCSKPLIYGIALANLGSKRVHTYVGQEPSGRMFNELILDYNHKPHNPMINAGAIIVSSILTTLVHPTMSPPEKFTFVQDILRKMSGDLFIGYNEDVYKSEKSTADRNYALGYYMKEHNCFPEGSILEYTLDLYFKCCAIEANCESMAVIAGTLANGGICPITEKKIVKASVVRSVLTIMHSCGTYDYSGQFAFKVGLPAKSGVCGGMMVVVPNLMGMFIWSPKLDQLGNSVRGIQFCEELIKVYNFHNFDSLHAHRKKDPRKMRFRDKSIEFMKLLFSAAAGDLSGLRRYKLYGLNFNLSDYDGRTALHLAASGGHLKCVQFLCRIGGSDPFKKDRWGSTPLDNAKSFGFPDVSEYLEQFMESGINTVNDPKFNEQQSKLPTEETRKK